MVGLFFFLGDARMRGGLMLVCVIVCLRVSDKTHKREWDRAAQSSK